MKLGRIMGIASFGVHEELHTQFRKTPDSPLKICRWVTKFMKTI